MPIEFIKEKNLFVLETENTTYAIEILKDKYLNHLYWGSKITRWDDFPAGEVFSIDENEDPDIAYRAKEEYLGWGGYVFDEPCLKVIFHDNVRDVILIYKNHEIIKKNNTEILKILLADVSYPIEVELFYKIYKGLDIIDRYSIVYNKGKNPITIERVQSATWYLPCMQEYRLTHLSGKPRGEHQIQSHMLTQSKTILESRKGTSGPDNSPYFALDLKGEATEESGEVYVGALHWSGNFKITIEKTNQDQVRVTGGINDFDFSWRLKPGEKFENPVFTGGFTKEGFGGASRMLHRYQFDYLVPRKKAYSLRPVIYNSWFSFGFKIEEQPMMELAQKAASLGIELFVIDDGWFGDRDSEKAGLGDWYPSPKKFPTGLNPLIEKVNSLGMDFGIWVEPEMVNPDSNLYRKNPDWVLHFPGRQRTISRCQLVLNLARDDVSRFVWDFLNKLLSEHNIKYLKWDMNRYLAEPGWPDAPFEDQKSVWVKYVLNLYKIFEGLQKRYPDVLFENCAHGGARADLGLARLTDRVNRSDNQDPLDSLKLHEGYTYIMLPKTAGGGGHIGPVPNYTNNRTTPLKYRAHVGMMGSLAVGLNLFKCSDEEMEELREHIKFYKEIRETTQNGDFYRLVSPRKNPYMAAEYVKRDRSEAILFVLGQSMQFKNSLPKIKLRGLAPDRLYDVEGYKTVSGNALMEIGIKVNLRGDFDSKVIKIKSIKENQE